MDMNWDNPSAPAPGGGGPGGPGGPGQAAIPSVTFPPIFLPPAGSQNFFAAGSQLFGVGPVAFAPFTGAQATVQLPQGMVGVIRSVTFVCAPLLITSVIQFGIRFSGNPAPGFGSRLMPQAGLAALFNSPDPTYIKVPAGNLIQMFAQVTDPAAYTLSFEISGWMYNKVIDDQWRGVV